MNVWSNLIGQNVNDRVRKSLLFFVSRLTALSLPAGCILLNLDSSTRKGDYNGNYVCLQVYIGRLVVARVGREGEIGLVAVMSCPGVFGALLFLRNG